jgi:hypothetical protein
MPSHKSVPQPAHVKTHLIKADNGAGWLMTVSTEKDKNLARSLPASTPRRMAMRLFSSFRVECGLNG